MLKTYATLTFVLKNNKRDAAKAAQKTIKIMEKAAKTGQQQNINLQSLHERFETVMARVNNPISLGEPVNPTLGEVDNPVFLPGSLNSIPPIVPLVPLEGFESFPLYRFDEQEILENIQNTSSSPTESGLPREFLFCLQKNYLKVKSTTKYSF